MKNETLRLGTRDSALALAQAHMVKDALKRHWPELHIELVTFKTQGDLILDTALSKIGDKGLFVKELELALLQEQIDLAVHSLKDMPGTLPAGLQLVSALEREDPRDVLFHLQQSRFADLPTGAVVGTSSLRRVAQLKRLRPDLSYQTVRGNLQTRYRKLEEGQYDALILAAAGARRLGWEARIADSFNVWDACIPAVAQGILGVEFRETDAWVQSLLKPLQQPEVEVARIAERAFLAHVGGGCQLPLGAYCRPLAENRYKMKAVILSVDGQEMIMSQREFEAGQAQNTGESLAQELLAQGGQQILERLTHSEPLIDAFPNCCHPE